jgi:uncharacterized protein (TIGR03083 family)
VDASEHIAAVAEQGELLLAAAEEAGLRAMVPTCPEWDVGDLLAHIGGVHRWAASYLVAGRQVPASEEEAAEYTRRPPDAELAGWARAAHSALVSALRQAPASLTCWTFLPAPSPLAFWARRQAHETAIHCTDARAAGGRRSHFQPAFAADGLDELLLGFYGRPSRQLRSEQPVVLGVELTDHPSAWTVTVGPDSVRTAAGSASGDCVVSGPASDVYQLLWNRLSPTEAGVEVKGRAEVLELWRSQAKVRWA